MGCCWNGERSDFLFSALDEPFGACSALDDGVEAVHRVQAAGESEEKGGRFRDDRGAGEEDGGPEGAGKDGGGQGGEGDGETACGHGGPQDGAVVQDLDEPPKSRWAEFCYRGGSEGGCCRVGEGDEGFRLREAQDTQRGAGFA